MLMMKSILLLFHYLITFFSKDNVQIDRSHCSVLISDCQPLHMMFSDNLPRTELVGYVTPVISFIWQIIKRCVYIHLKSLYQTQNFSRLQSTELSA